MAKNKQLQLSGYDFDGELDLPDFDFGDGPQVADDRSPTTKLIFAGARGYAESHFSPDNVRNFVKKSLPPGYGKALDTVDHTADTMRGIYHKTAQELKPAINEIKKSSQRLIPVAEKVLPKKMAEKFKNWTQGSGSGSGEMSPEQMKEAGIQAELGQIFKAQMENDQRVQSETNARERLRDGLSFNRHKDMLSALVPMSQAMNELAQYQRNIGYNYQRKSLELQLRSYYVAAESLEEAKQHNLKTTSTLEGILKNTGLPEFVKLKNSERLKEIIRNRFINGIGDSLADKRRNFVKNMAERLGKQLAERAKNTVEGVRSGLGAYESLAELRAMQAQFGPQQSGGEQAAELAGGLLSQHHTNQIAKLINGKLQGNEKVAKGNNRLMYYLSQGPQMALDWAKGNRGIGKNDFGANSSLLWGLKDTIRSVLSPESTNVDVDKLEDTRNPDMFNRRTNRSITDIIPGYLARIYREIKILRTGDESQELVEFDFTNNRFAESSTVKKNILNKLIGKGDKDWLKRELDEMVGELDKDKKLSPEQRKALGRLMMNNNLAGGVGDSKLYSNARSGVYNSLNSEDAEKIAAIVAEYFADDKTELKHQTFGRQFANLGTRISDKRETMQDFVNLNQRHHLEALGLLSPDGNNLDMEKFRDYLLAEDDVAPTPGAQPGRKVSRQRGDPQNSQRNRVTPQRVIPSMPNVQQPGAQQGDAGQQRTEPTETINREAASEIVRAIEAANPTSSINDSNRLLAVIIEMLQQGIQTHGGGGGNGSGGGGGRWWNRSIGNLMGGAWDKGMGAGRWLKGAMVNSGRRTKNLITGSWDFARKAGDWSAKKFKEFNDVYVEGEVKPRLLAWKLKAGEYYDQASGQVIKSYKDIRGAIVDAQGNIIMTAEDARKAFEKSRVGKKMLSALGFVKDKVKDGFSLARRIIPGVYGRAFDLGTKAIKKFGEFLDQPQDIYIAGKKDPVLLAVTMKAGGYASRISSNQIFRPSQIDGPVVDERGDIVLTAEQLASGLLDKYGKPLKTGYRGLLQRGKNMVTGALSFVKNSIGRTTKWLGEKASGLAKGFDMNFGVSMGRQARNQAVLLLQIRDMLNERLSGERTTFAEEVEIGPTGGGNAKKLVTGIKNQVGQLRDKVNGSWKDALKEKTAQMKEKLREKKEKGKEKMSSLFEKYFGKKKVAGDVDGDGIREGSYRDIMNKQKEKLKALKEAAAEKAARYGGGKGLAAMGMDKMKSLFDLLKRKKKGDDDDDDGGIDIDIDADGGDDDDRKRRRRRGRGRGRGRAGRAGRGLWNKTKGLGRGIGRGLMGAGRMVAGVGGGLGRGLLGTGLRMGAGALAGGLGVGGTLLSGAGAAAAGVGSALLTGAAAVGSGLLAVVSSPVVLAGLAVAAIGAAGYYGYKYYNRVKLDPYSTLRYAQYGFPSTDESHLQAIFDLEGQLQSAVVFDKDKASLDEKKIDIKKLLDTLGIDAKNRDQLTNFVEWFDNRFKPVFLNSVAAVRAADPSKTLGDVGKFTAAQKRKYLNIAKYPEGPYHVTASPFADKSELVVGKSQVAAAAEMAEAAVQKEEQSAPTTAKTGAATAAGAAAALSTVTAKDTAGLPGVKLLERVDVDDSKGKINQLAQQAQMVGAVATGAGAITMSGPDEMANVINTGRVDALTAIRYRTYGLTEMTAEKVRSLNLLEAEVQKGLTITKGIGTWTGSAETMIRAMGSTFGVQGVANDDAYAWINWFNTRFLPTYLAYVTACATATKRTNLAQAKLSLTPLQAVDVATMIYTAKGNFNGNSVSVWQIDSTPWPGFALNSDVKTTEGNFQSLKDQAKRSLIAEESTNVKQGVTGSSTGSETKEEAKGGFFDRLLADRKDATGKPSGNIFSRIYNNARDMMSGTPSTGGGDMSGTGREIAHPGKGTGGDVNSIPFPTGNGSYAALKPTIDAAAKMVGVDERLAATFAGIESGFNYKIKASTSSATGLFQFTRDTWNDMMKKFAAKYGIDPSTPPTDPRANAILGMEFLKYNAGVLKGLGRKITDTDLYLAHFFGAAGAKKFLSANPNDIAANVMPEAARANPNIFMPGGRALSISEVYAKLNALVRNKAKKFGLEDGSEKILTEPSGPATSASAPAAGALTATPAATPAPAPKPVAIPVSDQAPASAKAAPTMAAAAPVAASTKAAAPVVDPTSVDGYISPRTRNLAAQQQFQRDAAADALVTTNQILNKSLDVQNKLLENSGKLLEAIKGFVGKAPAASAVLDQPVQPVKPAKPARPMTGAPVSMSVNG